MKDLNKVMLIGNLVRDPELRTIPSGQTVASFAIATNRVWNDNTGQQQKSAEFTDIVAWGKLAEIAGQILQKGRRTYIEGRLQTRSWDGQDGVKRYKTEVVASDIIALDSKPSGINLDGNSAPAYAATTRESVSTESKEIKQEAAVGASMPTTPDSEIDIEDIPF